MDFYEDVTVEPSSTSYFSEPNAKLDPRLFQGTVLIGVVRNGILRSLFEHLNRHYYNPEAYIHAWLAGSGVSYQWSAQRDPADLDCLVGVNYPLFRKSNPKFAGLSDQEISTMFNEDFRAELQPYTQHYLGTFELTFYVNVNPDILSLKPYAAYSLTNDDWTVFPQEIRAEPNQEWEPKFARDMSMTSDIVTRYSEALSKIAASTNASSRLNAEAMLKLAVQQGASLFENIHSGRSNAFSPGGQGYSDYANYRWQAGKSTGLVQALKKLKDISSQTQAEFDAKTYGVELPSAKVLIRRAATYRSI